MKLVVTGGAGFVGANFVHHVLTWRPDWDVVVLDKLTYAGNLANLEAASANPRFRFVRMDVCDPQVADMLAGADAIVHLAAETHVDRSIQDAAAFVRTNFEGTWNLMECARRARVPRFLLVSTDEVYGSLGPEEKSTEASPLAPSNPYAASKAAADLLALSYVRTYGFPVIITRSSNNYGPYQFPEKFIPVMITRALDGQPLPIYGDGLQMRDWIHVADHCRALDLALERGRVGEIYNIGGGGTLTNLELARRILKLLAKPETLLSSVPDRPGHDRRYALDAGKITRELGWQPQRDFNHGLEETVRWYQEHRGWAQPAREPAT